MRTRSFLGTLLGASLLTALPLHAQWSNDPNVNLAIADRTGEQVNAKLDASTRSIQKRADIAFHPYWGSLFKQGVELSSFGDQVEEYACLYTSRVSNLGNYAPAHFFRSPRDVMPHEM